ncbi:MAG: translation elongation factor Ts [Planctomycetota bacterium]|jgi:elongation factor Ts
MVIDAKTVKDLRDRTGAPMMDCKQALSESDGDVDKALEYLRKKGLKTATKKAGREASEGVIGSYIHHNNKIGVLVEINCETDFAARSEPFQEFVKNITQHIAAARPRYLKREEVPEELIAKEREIAAAQIKGKPENIVEKIVDGKMEKFYQEICLLDQAYVKEDKKTISQLLTETIATVGENMRIQRFARYEVGE